MSLREHPSRNRILAELHARPFTPLPTGCRVVHFAFFTTPEEAEVDCAAILAVAQRAGVDPDTANPRYLLLKEHGLRWERHGEFVSYSFISTTNDSPAKWPEEFQAPGELLVAVDLQLIHEPRDPPLLVNADLVGGDASLASNFLPNPSGFVEMRLTNHNMSNESAGATVQRLLELETYRCMALLGLPVAERGASRIGQIEAELPDVMEMIDAAASLEDSRDLLHRLTALTLRLERSSAETHFRFGASRSYAELVRLRLEALAETSGPQKSGLTAFFSRRFDPAMRFCSTVSEREANLARKLTRAAQLLRTRVDVTLQSQNKVLLATMGNRLRVQMRLQRTVEGLSIAAIAYYVIGLLHYVIEGMSDRWPSLHAPVLIAGAVPLVLAAVSLTVMRIRRHHAEEYRPARSGAKQSRPAESKLPSALRSSGDDR